MSATPRNNSGEDSRRQPSRLQRRAPASLQINPVSSWNVAIPLLSPLASSPSSPDRIHRLTDPKPREDSRQEQQRGAEPEKVVFKKWQHPAAPFYYEPGPRVPSIVLS